MAADLHSLQYLHPFYVASGLSDLDAAFEDGKARAISTLGRQIERIKSAKREDYEAAFGVISVVKDCLTTDEGESHDH
ncbi:hypothetical protein [Arenimonas alkanexedens]